MSKRGDPRLPTADQIERHGIKDWAHRLVLGLYDRFRDIDSDLWDNPALNGLSNVTPTADTIPYFDTATTATLTPLSAFQSADAQLSAIAALSPAADQFPYFTSSTTAALGTVSTFSRTLLDDTTQGQWQSTLGLVPGTNVQTQDPQLQAIAGLSPAADQFPYFTSSTTAALGSITAAGRTLVGLASASAMRDFLVPFKMGSFQRDLTTASGTQSITDTGFQPRLVFFLAGVTTTSAMSIGIDDGTNSFRIFDRNPDGANTYGTASGTSIVLMTATSAYQTGVITSLNSNGFTVSWSKVGSPTGTADIFYLAFQ